MAKTYPVKWISSTFRGAPQVDGSVGGGGYLAALYAFLVTGFGTAQALSVIVSNGVGTAVFPASTVFETYSVLLIEGATSPASLNGEARVLSQAGSTITFETDAPDGTATGTITFKYAPAGWERVFSETNKAVFRSLDPQSSKFCIRVDDTGGVSVRVRGYESMSSIDVGTGPFPTDAQINGGGWFNKSLNANATKVSYYICADSRIFLSAISAGVPSSASYTPAPVRGFGDLVTLNPGGDAFAVVLSCTSVEATSSNSYYSYGTFNLTNNSPNGLYAARDPSGAGGARLVESKPYVGIAGSVSGADATLGVFPSSIDGELKYSRRYVCATDNSTPRANIPGILHIPQSTVLGSAKIAHGDFVLGSGELSGRVLLAIAASTTVAGIGPAGISLIDIYGPWR